MDIVFFGNEKLATGISSGSTTVDNLLKAGHKIKKIYTKNEEDIKINDIPISTSRNVDNIAAELKELRPQIGVLVAYGIIVPKNIIEIFPNGILNIHPSLLPRGRGPSPIEQTILEGDNHTGVSIMQLSEEMDKGPVLAQKSIDLSGKESKQELADLLLGIGNDLLIRCLDDIKSNRFTGSTQPEADTTYTHKINKSDGIINWNKAADVLYREIRAYAGWPKSRTTLKDISCIITDAEIAEASGRPGDFTISNKELLIHTSKGALLIKKIQPSGKKEMSTEEFLRGYAIRLK